MRFVSPHPMRARVATRANQARTARVCIVDRQPPETSPTARGASSYGAVTHHVTTAGEALRLSRAEPIDLWVINADLPDQSGIDLCSMLRERYPNATIFLIADSHSEDLERAAWRARPTLFGSRGQQSEWIEQWLERHRRPDSQRHS